MPQTSAGMLIYRFRQQVLEVLLVHPGGPFWAGKDFGAWSIPKGAIEKSEHPLIAARRELQEETGLVSEAPAIELPPVKLKSGKVIQAFAAAGDCDAAQCKSNEVRVQWPAR